MNKRIEELAEQHALPTLDSVDHLTGDRYKMFLYTEEGMMDFAKSIVLECGSICYKSFENGDDIAGLLMMTFGVEE